VIVDLEEDFRVFNQTDLTESSKASLKHQFTIQVSTNQEILNVPEGMVIQKRTLNLLTLGVLLPSCWWTLNLLPHSCLEFSY